jgi:hypothetical protein
MLEVTLTKVIVTLNSNFVHFGVLFVLNIMALKFWLAEHLRIKTLQTKSAPMDMAKDLLG